MKNQEEFETRYFFQDLGKKKFTLLYDDAWELFLCSEPARNGGLILHNNGLEIDKKLFGAKDFPFLSGLYKFMVWNGHEWTAEKQWYYEQHVLGPKLDEWQGTDIQRGDWVLVNDKSTKRSAPVLVLGINPQPFFIGYGWDSAMDWVSIHYKDVIRPLTPMEVVSMMGNSSGSEATVPTLSEVDAKNLSVRLAKTRGMNTDVLTVLAHDTLALKANDDSESTWNRCWAFWTLKKSNVKLTIEKLAKKGAVMGPIPDYRKMVPPVMLHKTYVTESEKAMDSLGMTITGEERTIRLNGLGHYTHVRTEDDIPKGAEDYFEKSVYHHRLLNLRALMAWSIRSCKRVEKSFESTLLESLKDALWNESSNPKIGLDADAYQALKDRIFVRALAAHGVETTIMTAKPKYQVGRGALPSRLISYPKEEKTITIKIW